MTDISAFPTITSDIVKHIGVTFTATAASALKAGMAVEFAASGEDFKVTAAVNGGPVIGVVGAPHASGDVVTVYSLGSIIKVANADDAATGDAGDYVETNDNAVGGTVSVAAVAATGGATATFHGNILGKLMGDMAASGTAYCLITLGALTQANSS